jgi:calcineurin-like phosphoesterase family protein
MKKYTATIKGTTTINQLGDILFKGKYREKKLEDKYYQRIAQQLMGNIVLIYTEEDGVGKYTVNFRNGIGISFTEEQIESIYDLTEIAEFHSELKN